MARAFNVLGPLQVSVDGCDVTPVAAKERNLLALLIVNHGRVVSTDRLVEELWPSLPPERARSSLHVRVAGIRKALNRAGASSLLEMVPPGYRLNVDADEVDATRFLTMALLGRGKYDGGDVAGAAVCLRGALALWRGEPLANARSGLELEGEAARLSEARLDAIEDWADAELRCGRYDLVLPEVTALAEGHPWRERLWRQRMTCLYRAGRQAEALAVGSDLRCRLVEQLGLDPSPELVRLERDILRHAEDLQVPVRTLQASPTGSRPGLPSLLRVARSSTMVGRHRERERLASLWRLAAAGCRQTALVAGEPGIGKTRLIAELAADAAGTGAVVVYGHCDEELEAPYRPWVDVVRGLLSTMSSDALARLGSMRMVLAHLVPELGSVATGEHDAETERLRLFEAAARLVQVVAASTPVLVVLDDLHWADRSSLRLFRHLVRGVADTPCLLVASYRDTDLAPRHPLTLVLADLRRASGVERFSLDGLDTDAVEEMLSERAGRRLDEARARELVRRLQADTAGNPFFLGELISHLVHGGELAAADDLANRSRPIGELGVPDGVREVVGRRLSFMPERAVEVLTGAAVVGSEFDAAVVADVLGRALDDVFEAVDAGLDRRLLVERPERFGRYRFAHAIVRQALEEQLSRTRRVRLHRRIALVLESAGAPATEVARHFVAGAPEGDAEKAMAWARQAGEEAVANVAYDEAAGYFGMALDAWSLTRAADAREQADLFLLCASAANRAGDDGGWRAAAMHAAEAARNLGDPERLAGAALSLVGTLGAGLDLDDDVVGALTDSTLALRATGSSPEHEALLAEVLARQATYFSTNRPFESTALAREALARARHSGSHRALAIALLSSTAGHDLERDDHQARLREATQLAEQAADWEVTLGAHTGAMVAALLWADRDEFDRGLAEYGRVAGKLGAVTPLLLNDINHAGAMALDGRYSDAHTAFHAGLARCASLGDPSHALSISAGIVPVWRELGRLAAMAPTTRRTVADAPFPTHRAGLMWMLAENGERQEATELLDGLLARPDELREGGIRRWLLTVMTEAVAVLGDATAARPLYEWLQDEVRHGTCVNSGAHAFHGALARLLGLMAHTLGHGDDAVDHHEAALEVHLRMRAPGWVARSRYDLASALRTRCRRGDVRRAADLLADAAATGHQLGMPKLLQEIAQLA